MAGIDGTLAADDQEADARVAGELLVQPTPGELDWALNRVGLL